MLKDVIENIGVICHSRRPNMFVGYLYNIKQYFLFVCGMFQPSSLNFEATDVWFSVDYSKSHGAGVSALYISLLLQVNP